MADDPSIWWDAPKNEAHKRTLQYVAGAETELGDIFERLFRLECLYDPNNPDADRRQQDRVTENAIASNIDTVSAVISTAQVRTRYMTDGGDWQQQRTAKRLEWYSEELGKRYEVHAKCRKAFKESSKKGNGLIKVHAVLDEPRVEHILLENVIVPPDECRDGRVPRQLHHWDYIDADELLLRYPDAATDIDRVRKTGRQRRNSYSRNMLSNDVECLWSYRLPVGKKPKDYNPKKKYTTYKPGRVTLVMEGRTLVDEPWHKPHFPVANMIWSDRINSFYAISGAERIMGIQRALNKNNWVIEKGNDNIVAPPIYVRPADANIGSKTNRVNGHTVYRADLPQTAQHQAVPNETYNRNRSLNESAQREFGQTSMATHGAKPAGIDSGVAMREFKDQSTQRFASQELAFEDLVLLVHYLLIDVCKDMGAKAPTVTRRGRFASKTMAWKDVDLGEARVQMAAAATLSRTPAGRAQTIIEYAQAGVISTDEFRRMSENPDIQREISLYTTSIELCEMELDAIADGEIVTPDPVGHLDMTARRAQREYMQWLQDGAPEEILENLRTYMVQAIAMGQMAQQAANGNAVPGAPDAAGAAPVADVGALPDPTMTQPAAALSQQAMMTRAS